MSDPADLNDRLNVAVQKAENGATIYHDVANQPEGVYVDTLSGPIPSLAEWQRVKGAVIDEQVAGILQPVLDAADRAELASANAAASANQKPTIADGLAATQGSGPDDRFFSVPGEGNAFSIQYRNDNGVPVEIGRMVSAAQVSAVLELIRPTAEGVPYVFSDFVGFVWGYIAEQGFNLPGMAVTSTAADGTTLRDKDGFLILEDTPEGTSIGSLSFREVPVPGLWSIDPRGFVWADLLNPQGSAPSPEPTIPSTVPVLGGPICSVQGEETSLYVRNILPVRSDTNLVRGTLASRSAPEIITSTDELRFDPERYGPQAYLYLRSVLTTESRSRLTLSCFTAPNPGAGAGNILTLGDSIQNRQGGQLQKQYLEAWGYTPTFIGTINGSASASDDDNAGGPLGEAREGWETGDFTYSVTDRVGIVAPGGEAAYEALPKLSKWNINPFLRAATGSDSPSIVRNGMVFDPANYQARFGLPTPTIVNITLGTNNVRDRSDAEIAANYHSDMTLIVSQCRAAWPLAKIVLSCPGTPRDVLRDPLWSPKYVPLLRSMLQVRNDFNSSNVIVFPVWAHVSQEAGYTITAPVTDPLTGTVTGATGDGIHPRESTRMQMQQAYAKMFACALANLI